MATLKSLVDETANIKNEIVECRDTLKQILIDKKLEDLENENKLPILIDKVKEFSAMKEKLWLYKNGNEDIELTHIEPTYGATIVRGEDSININANTKTSASYQSCLTLYNKSKIDLSEYNKLKVEFTGTLSSGNYGSNEGARVTIGTDDNINNLWSPTVRSEYICPQSQTVNLDNYVLELDISNINKLTYVSVATRTGATNRPLNKSDIHIYKIYLEK